MHTLKTTKNHKEDFSLKKKDTHIVAIDKCAIEIAASRECEYRDPQDPNKWMASLRRYFWEVEKPKRLLEPKNKMSLERRKPKYDYTWRLYRRWTERV